MNSSRGKETSKYNFYFEGQIAKGEKTFEVHNIQLLKFKFDFIIKNPVKKIMGANNKQTL